MARIASGVDACCHRHVPYDVINKRLSASFGRKPAENAEGFVEPLNDIVFIEISAFTAYIALGFFVYCFVRTEWPYRTKIVSILIAL